MDIGTLFAALIGGGFVLAAGRFERRDASKARREERTIIREFAREDRQREVAERLQSELLKLTADLSTLASLAASLCGTHTTTAIPRRRSPRSIPRPTAVRQPRISQRWLPRLTRRYERDGSADPPRCAHISASCRSSSSSQPRVAASWNIAWNSVESICGTLRSTHCRLNRFGTSNMAMLHRIASQSGAFGDRQLCCVHEARSRKLLARAEAAQVGRDHQRAGLGSE
jgi:hypothetical protein